MKRQVVRCHPNDLEAALKFWEMRNYELAGMCFVDGKYTLVFKR